MKIQSPKAGIGTGRAGLQAASGLFSSAGLFQKGVKAFHPNDLDPYLLFDARDSMIGTLENPTLDLDPSKPDTLNVITATRAGTATYTDVNGNIATAPADTVRVDHVDGVPMILVEPSSENLVRSSEDFTQNSIASNCSITSGVSAPDSSSNAFKLVEDNTNSIKLFRAKNTTGTTPNTSYSSSIFVKAGERTKVRIYGYHLTNQFFSVDYDLISNSALGTVTANTQVDGHSIEDYGDGWKRITVTGQKDNTYSWDVGVSPLDDSGNDTYQGDGTSGIYIWGAQLETGSVATSYIPTSGSTVTRAADDLVISGSDFSDFYNQSEGTFYVESELQRETEAGFQPFLFDADNGDANRVLIYNESAGDVLGLVRASGAGFQINLGTHPSVNTLSRTAFSYKANNLDGSKDGNSVTPVTTAVIPTTISRLNVGSHYTKAETLYLNGRIRRLIFWPYHSDSL